MRCYPFLGLLLPLMFFKTSIKQKDGAHYTHYRLCESYREGRFTRNRTLLSIGELESELPADKISLLCKRINQVYYEGKMFVISSFRDDRVEALCTNYVAQLREAETAEKAIKKAAVNCSCPNILNLPAGIKNPPGSLLRRLSAVPFILPRQA